MKAISFRQQLPIENPESLIDVVIDKSKPGPRDLLVQVLAISVNPVDTKIRKGSGPGQPSGDLKILGWDAAGIVAEVGSEVTLFIRSTAVTHLGPINATNLKQAHALVESGKAIGKVVLSGSSAKKRVGFNPKTHPHRWRKRR